jgi:hypothetical protein
MKVNITVVATKTLTTGLELSTDIAMPGMDVRTAGDTLKIAQGEAGRHDRFRRVMS